MEILNSFARNLNFFKIFKEIVIFRKFYLNVKIIGNLDQIWNYQKFRKKKQNNRNEMM